MRLLKAEKSQPDAETILKQVQHKVQKHDKRVWFWSFVIPNLFRDLGFGFRI